MAKSKKVTDQKKPFEFTPKQIEEIRRGSAKELAGWNALVSWNHKRTNKAK